MFPLPRILASVLLLSLLPANDSPAGDLCGTVAASAPRGADAPAGDGAYSSRRYKFAEKIDYARLRDFVVYIDQPVSEITPGAPALAAVTTQKDANFEPHVLPVAVGTTVRWPNEDDIYHNVFSMSETKEFDLGYYKKERLPELTFDKVGRVDVFCAIHSKMHCIILVLPNSYFSATGAGGRYKITRIPAGTYRVRAWHERLPGLVKTVVIPAEGEVKLDFMLGLDGLPKL